MLVVVMVMMMIIIRIIRIIKDGVVVERNGARIPQTEDGNPVCRLPIGRGVMGPG